MPALRLLLTAFVLTTFSANADVIYVSQGTLPPRDGQSWTTAYDTLTEALANSQSGDEIRVGQGTFRESDTLTVREGRTLRGGYAGFGAVDPDARDLDLFATLLSGDIN